MESNLASQLNGLKVSLEHHELIEELQFSEEYISATLGVKDGAVTSPLLKYTISDDLIIIRGLFDIIWKNIVFKENHIMVTRNGEPSQYRIVSRKINKGKRTLP